MSDILNKILETKRQEVAEAKAIKSLDDLREEAYNEDDPCLLYTSDAADE